MKDALSNKQADDWLCVKPKPSKLPTKYKNSQKYLFFSKISELVKKSRNPSKMIIFVKKTSDFLKWTTFYYHKWFLVKNRSIFDEISPFLN